MKLTNPTDAELNEAFAEKVAGWINQGKAKGVPALNHRWVLPDRTLVSVEPGAPLKFTTSADAVLPWLEKMPYPSIGRVANGDWKVLFYMKVDSGGEEFEVFGIDERFAKAAVIALLRAHGVEVEFTA